MNQHWSVSCDKNSCVGSGQCLVFADRVFQLDLEGRVDILPNRDTLVDADLIHDVFDAVSACPTGSISIVEVFD